MSKGVTLVDVRTPYQVSLLQQLLRDDSVAQLVADVHILAPEGLDLKDLSSHASTRYTYKPSDYRAFLAIAKQVLLLKKKLKVKPLSLLTALNFGPQFETIEALLKPKQVFLYEDGISSYLTLPINYARLKSAFYSLLSLSIIAPRKYKFFKGGHLQDIIVCNKSSLLASHAFSCSLLPVKFEEQVVENEFDGYYFLSSSSVEYGLQTMGQYEQIIADIAEKYSGSKLRVSFHHNEGKWPEKLELLRRFFDIDQVVPREIAVEPMILGQKPKIKLIAPFNTTAMNVLAFEGREACVALYDDGGPNIKTRKAFFNDVEELRVSGKEVFFL
ncbi:hypothetical protein [Neptuniibacter caesariensis]|uniref:Uncharacterized protein n=1 Tax=Neptuniibacter caesariensis TaxID=207954 RepID=A0A7U8C5Z7_NEPCE|nr:hypothetical protein [Neptuniibacter caesariensis]EAR60529.1 hypothetical protein MED92_16735 [Oceanospirillum sp. MED92] [Neptuniibacter caesariensis]